MAKPILMIKVPVQDQEFEELSTLYNVHVCIDDDKRKSFLAQSGGTVDGVLTNGTVGITPEEMKALSNVKVICCMGAGYEGVDLVEAKRRGIMVTHGPGTNDTAVADHTLALLFAIVRDIPHFDAQMKGGGWKTIDTTRPMLSGKKLGIYAMGRIGMHVAKRASAFDMEIHYHNRNKRNDVDYIYEPSVMDLARVSDFFIVIAPGGPETFHTVNADVLKALGPKGYIISVGRGSVVDTDALIAALNDGTIAGAGLDVYETEPDIPAKLLSAKNIVLSPHIAGRAPETRTIMYNLFKNNLANALAGKPPVTPVPELAQA
jgi:lactate dehydrogenase-like 2-hydroxyacid dehydrogenase